MNRKETPHFAQFKRCKEKGEISLQLQVTRSQLSVSYYGTVICRMQASSEADTASSGSSHQKISSRKRKRKQELQNPVFSKRAGRPRIACYPCNKSKVKCNSAERPCPRCVKRGAPEECTDSMEDSLKIATTPSSAQEEDVIDLTDLIEESILRFHSSPEQWKRMIIEETGKW
jgi:hypothetical protein